MKRTNKLSIPKILVAGANSALSTNALVDSSNSLGVTDGQLSVLSWDYAGTVTLGTGISAGTTAANVAAVKVIQGTPASSNITLADNVFQVGDTGFLESGIINRDKIFSFAAKRPRVATNGAVLLTPSLTDATANTQYGFYTELISQSIDRDNSDNDNVLSTVIETPDWGVSGVATPGDKRDWILQNLAVNLNSRSKAVRSSYGTGVEDVIVFGIRKGATTSASAHLDARKTIGALALGDRLRVQTINGINTDFVIDRAFMQTIAQLITVGGPLVAASTFETLDLSIAGTSATNPNRMLTSLLVMGLPRTKSAYYDNVEQLYPNVKVNPGFAYQPSLLSASGNLTIDVCAANDGVGQGWKLRNMNDLRNQLFVHTMQTQPMGEWFSLGKEYINEDTMYYQYTIEYFDTENTINSEVISPKQLIILSPATIGSPQDISAVAALTNKVFGMAATQTNLNLEAVLGAWLKSCVSSGFSSIQLKGDATSATYFLVN